jgi:hypothetical protein
VADKHSHPEDGEGGRGLGGADNAAPKFVWTVFERADEFGASCRGKEDLQVLRRTDAQQQLILCGGLLSCAAACDLAS